MGIAVTLPLVQENMTVCPLLDSSYPRCSNHLSLKNLIGAFTHCADRFVECPIYRDLLAKASSDERQAITGLLLATT